MSNSGKSTLATGIMAALSQEWIVQGFKVGPDYIDPGYHTVASQRISRNLDSWMVPHDRLKQSYINASKDADIVVIEGVMGLYDGYDALSEQGSTAQLAKLLNAPILLVIDVGKMARSAGAIALGFRDFDPDLRIGGVICNNVASENHARWVTQAIEAVGMPVLGCVPRNQALHIPERHLGLHTAIERQEEIKAFIQQAGELVKQHLDLEQLVSIAGTVGDITAAPVDFTKSTTETKPVVRIGVARDESFSFYYEDNFDYLRAAGAEIVFFSPIHNETLPEDIAGIYLGGGYPELYAEQLCRNEGMLTALREAIQSNIPLYAECGGLMILTEKIVSLSGDAYPMLGVLPGYTVMRDRVRLGYREVTAQQDSPLLKQNETIRGHEFHYSEWVEQGTDLCNAYHVHTRKQETMWQEGVVMGNLLASYIHLHFGSLPQVATRFVEQCVRWQNQTT